MSENRRGFMKWVGAALGLSASKVLADKLDDGTNYYDSQESVGTSINGVAEYQLPLQIQCSGTYIPFSINTGPR